MSDSQVGKTQALHLRKRNKIWGQEGFYSVPYPLNMLSHLTLPKFFGVHAIIIIIIIYHEQMTKPSFLSSLLPFPSLSLPFSLPSFWFQDKTIISLHKSWWGEMGYLCSDIHMYIKC